MEVANSTALPQSSAADHAIRLLARENKILELIARGSGLQTVLTEIAYAAEAFCDADVRCSILLLDETGTHLLHGAAPSLPNDYNDKINGLPIGPNVGSCGASAFTGKQVVTIDIEQDPNWAKFKQLALSYGLRGAWSTPIISSQGDVLGTFGIYFMQPSVPTERASQVVDLLARTAAIAIERHRSETQRVRYQKQIETLNDTGIFLAAERDLQKILQAAIDTAREFSGAAFGAFFYNIIGEDGESYMLYTLSGAPREAFSKFPRPRNTEVFAPTFAGTETVRVADIKKDPRYGKNAPGNGMPHGHLPVCSYLAVPVISRTGKVIGGMFFGHPEPGKFTAEGQHLVESIAAQAAVAIDNAQLNDGLTQQLAASEEVQERLAVAQQAAQLATWELDLNTGAIQFSPGSWPVFGCELSKLKSRTEWEQQIHPDDRDQVHRRLEDSVANRADYSAEYRVQTPLGIRWVIERGHALFSPNTGAPERVVILSADITDRKQSEQALRISDQKFREAQQAAHMGAWFWDIPSDRITWSIEVPSLEGAVTEQFGRNWMEAVHPDDAVRAQAEVGRAIRNGGSFRVECRLRCADGSHVWCFMQGQITLNENRVPISGVGIAIDITARKDAEQELQRAEERFNMIVDSADLGFWYCDLPFEELRWDARTKDHFWLPPDAHATIENFYQILHPDDRERTRVAIETAIGEHKLYDIDYRTVSRTGEVKWIRAVGRAFYERNGKPVRFDGITMDITARRRAEEALRSSEKLAATGRLAATIAHEINNPLEAVTNFIYLAKATEGIPQNVHDYLEVADQELGRVSHIARQTLGFYRDSSGPKLITVAELVQDVLNLYQRKLQYKTLDVQTDVPEDLRISGLAGEMRQVLSNLLANAIDASPESGTIRIRAQRGRDWRTGQQCIRISVADTGCGMSQETQKRLFTPFFTTKSDVGTGLGLWVTKGMVEKARGRILVRSRENAGTVFTMIFPSILAAGTTPAR